MKILFSMTLLVIALALGGMTYLSSKQDRLTGEPHVVVKVTVPPKEFFEESAPQAAVAAPAPVAAAANEPQGQNNGGELDPGKLLQSLKQPPAEEPAPAPVAASNGPAEVIPGLAVEGFNEQGAPTAAEKAAVQKPAEAAAAAPVPAPKPAAKKKDVKAAPAVAPAN